MSTSPYHLGNFSLSDQGPHGCQQPQFSLGNFQLPQPQQFNLPPVGFTAPAMPALAFDLSTGLGPVTVEPLAVHPQPLLFDVAQAAHQGQPSVREGLELSLELMTASASQLELPGVHGLERLSLVKSALETGHKLHQEISHDIKSGRSTTEATLCAGLGVLAEAGVDHVLKGGVVAATIGGISAAAGASAAGVLTMDPPLAAAGASAAVIFSQLALPAYQSAGNTAAAIGQGTTQACHDAFDFAKQFTSRR